MLSTSTSSYSPAFSATTGWDFATGIGSINVYNLVTNWPALGAALAISTTSLKSGVVGRTPYLQVLTRHGRNTVLYVVRNPGNLACESDV